MRLSILAPLVASLAVPLVLLYARRHARRSDPKVDAMIAAKGAGLRDADSGKWIPKPTRAEYATPDHQKIERAGEVRWQETLQGQRRLRKKPRKRSKPENVRAFPRAANGG